MAMSFTSLPRDPVCFHISVIPTWRQQRLPGSWGILVYMPCSKTPVGPYVPSHSGTMVLPSTNKTVSAPTLEINFEAQLHGLHTRCLRFAFWVTPAYARLASDCWLALPGRD